MYFGQESKQCLLPDHTDAHDAAHQRNRRTGSRRWIYLLVAFILVGSNVCTFITTRSRFSWPSSPHGRSSSQLAEKGGVVVAGLRPPRVVTFESTLNRGSVYRGEPSEATDAAWEALGANFRYTVLSQDDAALASISPEHVALPEGSFQTLTGFNTTEGGYIANVEVMHQLHCLNFMRKSLWFNADYYKALGKGPFADNEDMLVKHVGHCLDMLREKLMCDADTGFVPYYWLRDDGRTVPDFQRPHVCRDFEGVRKWAEGRQRHLREGIKMTGPPSGGYRVDDFP